MARPFTPTMADHPHAMSPPMRHITCTVGPRCVLPTPRVGRHRVHPRHRRRGRSPWRPPPTPAAQTNRRGTKRGGGWVCVRRCSVRGSSATGRGRRSDIKGGLRTRVALPHGPQGPRWGSESESRAPGVCSRRWLRRFSPGEPGGGAAAQAPRVSISGWNGVVGQT